MDPLDLSPLLTLNTKYKAREFRRALLNKIGLLPCLAPALPCSHIPGRHSGPTTGEGCLLSRGALLSPSLLPGAACISLVAWEKALVSLSLGTFL